MSEGKLGAGSRGTDHRHPQRAPGWVLPAVRALPQVSGSSGATFYKWRSTVRIGMEVSDARKLKGLEDENSAP